MRRTTIRAARSERERAAVQRRLTPETSERRQSSANARASSSQQRQRAARGAQQQAARSGRRMTSPPVQDLFDDGSEENSDAFSRLRAGCVLTVHLIVHACAQSQEDNDDDEEVSDVGDSEGEVSETEEDDSVQANQARDAYEEAAERDEGADSGNTLTPFQVQQLQLQQQQIQLQQQQNQLLQQQLQQQQPVPRQQQQQNQAGQATDRSDQQAWEASGKTSFGYPHRGRVVTELTKMHIAKLNDEITFEDARRAAIKGLNLPASSAAERQVALTMLRPMQSAITKAKNEAHSGLVTQMRSSAFLIPGFGFAHPLIPNAKKTPALAGAAKADHELVGSQLMSAPPGFHLMGSNKYMYAIHSSVVNGRLRAFGRREWCNEYKGAYDRFSHVLPLYIHLITISSDHILYASHFMCRAQFVTDYVTHLPSGRTREITLELVAFMLQGLKAMFTFTDDAEGVPQYGAWNNKIFTLANREEIKTWLLDEDACPTDWEPLLAIRTAYAA